MHRWAVLLRRSELAAAAVLRTVPGLEIAEAAGLVWIRGGDLDDPAARQLRGLPVVEIYDLWPDGQLVIRGHRVPTRRLPEANWVAIRHWFELELPAVAWPSRLSNRIPMRLVRSGHVDDVSLLLTTLGDWLEFGTHAPGVRLENLRFAACEDKRVLIQGHPVPALRGTRFVCSSGVAVPAGWRWEPMVDAGIVADVLQVAEGDMALLIPEASSLTVEVVAREQFVRATRSSIRATAEALTSG
ncbi:MAG TPA: hypothetical protein VMM76_07090 [Pirellulaceae bacterium]|nr:hypothetical protein [Pirellulaceae bacterium]